MLLAPPPPPKITLISTTTNSIELKLKTQDNGHSGAHGYTIHYKPEFSDWETAEIAFDTTTYTLRNLWCGTRYQLYVTAFNE